MSQLDRTSSALLDTCGISDFAKHFINFITVNAEKYSLTHTLNPVSIYAMEGCITDLVRELGGTDAPDFAINFLLRFSIPYYNPITDNAIIPNGFNYSAIIDFLAQELKLNAEDLRKEYDSYWESRNTYDDNFGQFEEDDEDEDLEDDSI